MDIQIDCGSIFWGLKSLKELETSLENLRNEMTGIILSTDLTSLSLFYDARNKISNICTIDLPDVIERLEESKSILEKNDQEAAYLFSYYEQGILTEDGKWNAVPLMTQDDYKHIKYSQGSVASSGCGVTSLCMVASYILGKFITPEDIAAYANKSAGDNVKRMTNAADYYGLEWVRDKNTSKEDLVNYLKEGKLVICLVKGSSHFVVCTGINENGQIAVNDPYRSYRKESHQDGYTWDELKFSPGSTWIFDPAQTTGAAAVNGTVTISNTVAEKLQIITPDGQYTETVTDEKIVLDDKNTTLNKEEQAKEQNTENTYHSEETTKSENTTSTETKTEQTQSNQNTQDVQPQTQNTNTSSSTYTSNYQSSSQTSSQPSNQSTNSQPSSTTTNTEIVRAPSVERNHTTKTDLSTLDNNISSLLDKIKEDNQPKTDLSTLDDKISSLLDKTKEETSIKDNYEIELPLLKDENTSVSNNYSSTTDYINTSLNNLNKKEEPSIEIIKPNGTITPSVKVPNTKVDNDFANQTSVHKSIFVGSVATTIAAVTSKIGSLLKPNKSDKKDNKKDS